MVIVWVGRDKTGDEVFFSQSKAHIVFWGVSSQQLFSISHVSAIESCVKRSKKTAKNRIDRPTRFIEAVYQFLVLY